MRQLIIQRMMAILEEKNISERQISVNLGYSDSYMNKVKKGIIALTIDFVDEFCKELNVQPESFWTVLEANTSNQYLLLRETKDLTEEDIQHLCHSAQYLKKKNQLIRRR